MGLQKTTKTDLAKSSNNTLPLVQISKTADLLACKSIIQQVKDVGEEVVLINIRMSIEKCAMSLGIQMTDNQIQTICHDTLDTYRFDSIEDVIECLKKARRGSYGFGMNSRNTFNMVLLSEWMAKHLEEKSIAIEKALSIHKSKGSDKIEEIDYDAYKKRMSEKKDKKTNANENAYQRFKIDYLNPKK